MTVYHVAKIIQKILMKVPLWVSAFLGRLIGIIFYYYPRKRRVAFRNIKMAFPEKSKKELYGILKKSFIHLGLDIVENLIAPRLYKYVTIKGDETIATSGGIFVGIHAGNWETCMSVFAHKRKFAVLAKPQKNRELDRFLTELRERGKIHVCFSVRELMKCIQDNYTIGIVIDHGAEKDASAVDFFDHSVPTPKGAVYLAKRYNKLIYPDFCYRQQGFYHVSEVCAPIDPTGREDREVLNQLNKIYEEYLMKYPWEYFWYYKRFKRKRNRDVVILTDLRPGHFKQSQAFLNILSQNSPLLNEKVIAVRYKNKFCRILANIFACFVSKHCLIAGKLLAFCVDNDTWRELDSTFADIVVSAGNLTAPVNKLFSSYLGAKSVVILRPNVLLRKFDLAIIPEHDRIRADNAVMIKGALFYPDNLEKKLENCRRFFNLGAGKTIALFVGGPIMDKREFAANLKVFIPKLKRFCLKKGYGILVSTSKRTPPEIDRYIEEKFKGFSQTQALVIFNRENYDFVFEGFSALADITFVTSESISMVSEAASFNKVCVCVFLEIEDDKRRVFLETVKQEVVFLRRPFSIENTELKPSSIWDRNRKIIKEAIGALLK